MVAKNYFQAPGSPEPDLSKNNLSSNVPGMPDPPDKKNSSGPSANIKSPEVMTRNAGKQILMNKVKIQEDICLNILIGTNQIKEGKKILGEIKGNITEDIWKSKSAKEYQKYLEQYELYIDQLAQFFNNFSKKLIDNAEVFEELDTLMQKQLNFEDWRPE
ncbi:hypothetical protein [Carnobacterium divergens]|uniref:Uncharacterized protein n=1 Tax=Carnobacterium divergens DSM 20623 TaxID=1449336 RepID=A0A0R2HYK9_CARDV|nr:hypothetical protein [Carnobacterium divergens]KRN54842.1 hypothetical protein IV74_GL002433 [Carnobacterium divergens DSM 20623]MDO0874328.1 hypothetical protein [Carnobacterium divergens]SUX21450.1 Uncharacterised protein [Carnobacterium divergens]